MASERPSLRARQAQLTQQEILGAARRLFAENGYTRTSVRDIAKAAGVSAQTVYDSIGSKQALVARLNDLIDTEAGIGTIVSAVGRARHDPATVVATSARVTRSILENCGDILTALVTGSSADPELAVVLDEGHRRHVDGARATVDRLVEMKALRPSIDGDSATETLAALADVRFALVLRDDYGWSLDKIEAWMSDASRALLLG